MFDSQNLEALDPARHGTMRLKPVTDYGFARATHALPVAGTEFGDAAKEYPIVFMQRPDNTFLPTAMVGLRQSQNLFVDADGHWTARYIPFFVRRYPFVVVDVREQNDAVMCLDRPAADALLDPNGTALFNDDGKPSEATLLMAQHLFAYRDDALKAGQWCKLLQDQKLFKQVTANANLPGGETLAMEGMWVVDDEKLRELPAPLAHEWLGNGLLALIHAHLLSLGNLHAVVERAQKIQVESTSST